MITLYDFEDKAHEIDIMGFPDILHVKVISGDEIVIIDGKKYDTGIRRAMPFYDYKYDVAGYDNINHWLHFEPDQNNPLPFSYQRADAFIRA